MIIPFHMKQLDFRHVRRHKCDMQWLRQVYQFSGLALSFFVSSCSQLIQNRSSVIHSTNLSSLSSLRLERKQLTLLLFYSTHRHLFEITKKNQSPQNTLKTKKISKKSCPRVLFNAFQWPRFECGYLFISAKSYFGYGYLTKPANKVDIDILASGKTYHHCKIKETLCIPNLG